MATPPPPGSGTPQPQDAQTLREILDDLEQAGYTGQFAAREGANVICFSCHTEIPATEMELWQLRRTEGVSDPDDMLAVAALCCPRCGAKGTAALNYGPQADIDDAEVLTALEDRREQN